MDTLRLREIILEEIGKHHPLGEQAGGSGHLGHVSLTNLEIGEPVEIDREGEQNFEIPLTFETYTESEFSYTTNGEDSDVWHSNVFHAILIIDRNLNVVEYRPV